MYVLIIFYESYVILREKRTANKLLVFQNNSEIYLKGWYDKYNIAY